MVPYHLFYKDNRFIGLVNLPPYPGTVNVPISPPPSLRQQSVGSIGIVDASTTKSHIRATHTLDGCGTGEDDQITPREAGPEHYLDRIEKFKSLSEIRIIGPVEFWIVADTATVASSTPIRISVGSGAMPGETDEKGSVVAKISRPEPLRVNHDFFEFIHDSFVPTFGDAAFTGTFVEQSQGSCLELRRLLLLLEVRATAMGGGD